MKLKAVSLAVASAVAVVGFTGSVASAQSSGDGGGPPQNRTQCQQLLKSVDKALVWENKRYDKEYTKLDKKRTALKKKATTLGAQQVELQHQIDAVEAAIMDEVNPPSPEDAQRLSEQDEALLSTHDQNARDLQDIADTLDGMKFDFSYAKKNHTTNVRSTVKYRKQVATYCKRFK